MVVTTATITKAVLTIPVGLRWRSKRCCFTGDVRDHAIFWAIFRHPVNSRYGKGDTILLLRTSLQQWLLEFIKGISTDYNTTWSYLVSVYEDPICNRHNNTGHKVDAYRC